MVLLQTFVTFHNFSPTLQFNGNYWLRSELPSVLHLKDLKTYKRDYDEKFSLEKWKKQMKKAEKIPKTKGTHYNLIYISDCAKTANGQELLDFVDYFVDECDTPINTMVYAHENSCSNFCEAFPENDSLSLQYLLDVCQKPQRSKQSTGRVLSFMNQFWTQKK